MLSIFLKVSSDLQVRQLQAAEILLSLSDSLGYSLHTQHQGSIPSPFAPYTPNQSIPQQQPSTDAAPVDTEREIYHRLKFKLHRTKPHQNVANLKHKPSGGDNMEFPLPAKRTTSKLFEVSFIFFSGELNWGTNFNSNSSCSSSGKKDSQTF